MAARDAPIDGRPARARLGWALARPRWLLRIERGMRPLDHLSRGVALGVGAAAGAGAGLVLGWSGERWTLAAGAALLAGAGWLVRSAEAVAVVERSPGAARRPPAEPPPELPVESVAEATGVQAMRPPVEPPPEPPPPRLSDALGMVELPGGRFWMGSAEDDPRADGDERPRHEVEVGSFAMGKYVVTQKLYREVMETDPGRPKGDALPANDVSWFDAVRFCNALSAKEGLRPAYRLGEGKEPRVEWDPTADGFRLPTEAEWEYAARAGTTAAYSFGDDESLLDEHAWWAENAEGAPHPVGTKKPNPWGLFDVHGNVYEWCWDIYGAYDKPRPSVGGRVVRGGSFRNAYPRDLRSANRPRGPPGNRDSCIGFRCARGGSRQP